MLGQATTTQQEFDQRLDALKSGIHKLVDKATTRPTWFGRAATQTATIVRAHPVVAVGLAVGLGYIVVRATRQ